LIKVRVISTRPYKTGDSMDKMTKELGSDVEKSRKNQKDRESIDKANLEKIWGKKDE